MHDDTPGVCESSIPASDNRAAHRGSPNCAVMGKQKKTRKFAEVKRILNPKEIM